ncbi:MAG: cysteine synthase family protein [Thermodesulfovibrionales bacterium]|nr:cysteine synthase family protein [Thermodesulfovibrionales bacterium]
MATGGIIEAIGHTPLIRLERLAPELDASLYIKLEGMNPGGSHKARVALRMVLEAESEGRLTRGSGQTIIEPTGGNTGIGLAIISAALGYKAMLVIPDNYSREKQRILKAMGAEVVLSDSSRGLNSHVELMWDMLIKYPDYVYLDQFGNPANVMAHKEGTAPEIIDHMNHVGGVDFFVCGIGTAGSITGIGEALKERYPGIMVVGVQPEGCDVLNNKFVPHEIQGIAAGIVPSILNRDIIDEMVSVSLKDTMQTLRLLCRKEGLFLGVSSGAYVWAAMQVAKKAGKGARVLTISPDFGEGYLDYYERQC